MKYPCTTFSYFNAPKVNGAGEYTIWRHLGPHNQEVKGSIFRTTYGKWQATVYVPRMGNGKRSMDFDRLAEAKAWVREMLE